MKQAPENDAGVPGLDPVAARRWLGLSTAQSPWLHEEVASRMVERLKWFREKPASWLHWEPVAGGLQAHQQLRECLHQSICHVASRQMPQALQATREPANRGWNPLAWTRPSIPQAATDDSRVGMLWANMALHHEAYPQSLLERWHQMVDTNGFLMFSCLGPDSLKELRAVYAQSGWPEPSHAFTDMHDWGDRLVQSGFAEPVMDMERIQLAFSSAQAMLDELRTLGRNLNDQRFSGLRGRHWEARLCQTLEEQMPRSSDGRMLLTFEIVYGHAFKPAPRASVGPRSAVSVDEMRAMLRSGRR